jgi:large subunit ribosomal protein L25
MPVAVPTRALKDALRAGGANVLVDLRIPDLPHAGTVAAMIRQVQRDPIMHQPLHVDFQWVSLADKITATVAVVIEGEAPGLLVGGVVDQILHEVEVECLPQAIPERLVVDISGMEIRDSRHVRDLQVPEGVTVLTPEDETVVSIVPPMAEEVVAAVEGEVVVEEETAE